MWFLFSRFSLLGAVVFSSSIVFSAHAFAAAASSPRSKLAAADIVALIEDQSQNAFELGRRVALEASDLVDGMREIYGNVPSERYSTFLDGMNDILPQPSAKEVVRRNPASAAAVPSHPFAFFLKGRFDSMAKFLRFVTPAFLKAEAASACISMKRNSDNAGEDDQQFVMREFTGYDRGYGAEIARIALYADMYLSASPVLHPYNPENWSPAITLNIKFPPGYRMSSFSEGLKTLLPAMKGLETFLIVQDMPELEELLLRPQGWLNPSAPQKSISLYH